MRRAAAEALWRAGGLASLFRSWRIAAARSEVVELPQRKWRGELREPWAWLRRFIGRSLLGVAELRPPYPASPRKNGEPHVCGVTSTRLRRGG